MTLRDRLLITKSPIRIEEMATKPTAPNTTTIVTSLEDNVVKLPLFLTKEIEGNDSFLTNVMKSYTHQVMRD